MDHRFNQTFKGVNENERAQKYLEMMTFQGSRAFLLSRQSGSFSKTVHFRDFLKSQFLHVNRKDGLCSQSVCKSLKQGSFGNCLRDSPTSWNNAIFVPQATRAFEKELPQNHLASRHCFVYDGISYFPVLWKRMVEVSNM